MLLVIDGPEKAGKSTLAAALVQWWNTSYPEAAGTPVARIRKWSRLDDGRWAVDSVYRDALVEDSQYGGLAIWDRSWASEAVYARLLNRNRRLGADPWLGEWLYGRGVVLKFILAGPHPSIMAEALDDDDRVHGHGQDMAKEQRAFMEYGVQYGWNIIGTGHADRLPLETILRMVQLRIAEVASRDHRDPRAWCGPQRSPVVFVGERGSNYDSMVGGWLPFSSNYTSAYGRLLGDAALRVGWTNAWDDQRGIFDHARLVIACGATAAEWAREVRQDRAASATKVEQVYHPAALYRWGRLRDSIPSTERTIREMVSEYLPVGEPSMAQGEPVNA
jgi:nicotinamide riboside kinase